MSSERAPAPVAPVAVAVAAPLAQADSQAESLPQARALQVPVTVPVTVPVPVPDLSAATSRAIETIVQQQLSASLRREHERAEQQLSCFKVALAAEMQKSVVRDVADFLQNYAKNELPAVVSSRADVLFPRFVSNSSVVKKHLADHMQTIDELVSARKKELTFELDVVATAAADKMAHTDTFGYIYEAVVRSANKRVTEESRRVQVEMFERVEADLIVTRKQRDAAMSQFSRLNGQLEDHLRDQQKYKIMAFSGFCMGMVSLTSLVLANVFEKR